MIVSPPPKAIEKEELKWQNVVVVQFEGKIPNFSLFQRMVNVFWEKDGEIDIQPVEFNLFIIKFSNSEMRD